MTAAGDLPRCAAALCAAVAALATGGPAATAQTATATDCSVAVAGSVSNSNISACSFHITIIQQVARATQEQGIDPSILRQVARGDYDAALESIESFAAARPAAAAAYLTIGASLLMVQGRPEEAVQYARRALEADPANGEAVLRYAAALQVTGRRAEATALLTSAYRRRAQFTRIGRAALEAANLELTYPPEILEVWDEGRECSRQRQSSISPAAANGAVVEAAEADCAVGAAAAANVRAFRTLASSAVQTVGSASQDDLMALQLRYHLLSHVLVADRLLNDRRAQADTEREIEATAALLRSRHGPWALLTSITAAIRLATLLPRSELERSRRRFGLALDAAATAPLAALARNPGDEQLLPRASSLMLASYRVQRAALSAALDHDEEAWAETVRAIGEARTPGSGGLGVIVRINSMILLAALVDKGQLALDSARGDFISREYRLLRREFSDDPRQWAAYGQQLLDMNDALCEIDAISDGDCELSYPGLE